jgi:hypothetical protein
MWVGGGQRCVSLFGFGRHETVRIRPEEAILIRNRHIGAGVFVEKKAGAFYRSG